MKFRVTRVIASALAVTLWSVAAMAQTREEPEPRSNLNVEELFSSTCGFCHIDGGREAGRGPQLMDTKRSDDFIRNRIKNGKPGAMPAFGASFSDEDINAIIYYIRHLKPEKG